MNFDLSRSLEPSRDFPTFQLKNSPEQDTYNKSLFWLAIRGIMKDI